MPKTGTTSLQLGLCNDRESLISKGVLYPNIDDYDFQWPLMLPFLDSPEQHHMIQKYGYSATECKHFTKKYLRDFYQTLENGGGDLCVLSNEGFSDITGKNLRFFRNFLDKLFDEYTVIVYNRKASSLYPSYLQELLKAGVAFSNLPDPSRYRSKTAQTIQQFTEVFAEKVQVIQFDPCLLYNGSTVDDFYHRYLPCQAPEITRQNTSLPTSTAIALALISEKIPRFDSQYQGENPLWGFVRKALTEADLNNQQKFSLPEEWTYTIARNHGEDTSAFKKPQKDVTPREFQHWLRTQVSQQDWIQVIEKMAMSHLKTIFTFLEKEI